MPAGAESEVLVRSATNGSFRKVDASLRFCDAEEDGRLQQFDCVVVRQPC